MSDSHSSQCSKISIPNPLLSVVFVLGGPGAGKGTQCSRLAQEFYVEHISVGDVLRAEIDSPESRYGPIIKKNMEEGRIGPIEITVELLHNAISVSVQDKNITLFLIDGRSFA